MLVKVYNEKQRKDIRQRYLGLLLAIMNDSIKYNIPKCDSSRLISSILFLLQSTMGKADEEHVREVLKLLESKIGDDNNGGKSV